MAITISIHPQQNGMNRLYFDDLWNLDISSDVDADIFLVGTITEDTAGLILTACTEIKSILAEDTSLTRQDFSFKFISVPPDYGNGDYAVPLKAGFDYPVQDPGYIVPDGNYHLTVEIWTPGNDGDISPAPQGNTAVDWVIPVPKSGDGDISPAPQGNTQVDRRG